jgi:RimJ/RimL family protein N-acetyltransferase
MPPSQSSSASSCQPSTSALSIEQQSRNLRFRELRPEDLHRLQRFHQRLSDLTILLRFHGAKRELTEPLAHRLTTLDGHDEAAIVATTGTRGRIVGVARYSKLTPELAEVAFVVEDAFQGHGIGKRLLHLLLERARENGVREIVAEVLSDNSRTLHLLEGVGPTRTIYQQGVCEVHVDITK